MEKKLFDRQTEKVLTITLKRLFWILWIVIGIFLYKDSFVNNRIMQEVRTIRQADTVCIVLSDNRKSTAALPNNADDYEFTMRYRHVDSPCQVATLHFSKDGEETAVLRLMSVPETETTVSEAAYQGKKYFLSGTRGITKFLYYSLPESISEIALDTYFRMR